jgi:hypothetical protein
VRNGGRLAQGERPRALLLRSGRNRSALVDNARPESAKVLALAQALEIDAILVTELSR